MVLGVVDAANVRSCSNSRSGIEASSLDSLEGFNSTTGHFAYTEEVALADASGIFVDDGNEVASWTWAHVLHSVNAETMNVSVCHPILADAAESIESIGG